jgi:hypothetical protein
MGRPDKGGQHQRGLGARFPMATANFGAPPGKPFRLWAFGDAHVGTDHRFGRKSLAEAIAHSEQEPFDWDIAINVGDLSGSQAPPDDAEGQEVVGQLQSLATHKREDIYDICGNHDRSGLDQPDAWWFQKWVDPLGQHTEFSGVHSLRRRYPIDGTWERYSFRVGNILFLMMSDRNEPSQTIGRGALIEQKWGVHFLNVAALTQHHVKATTTPMSRLLTFSEGSQEVRVRCYLHSNQYAPRGWYSKADRVLTLARPFRW